MFYYHYRVLTLSFQQNLELSFRCFTSPMLFLYFFSFLRLPLDYYGVESYHQFIFRAPSLAKLSSSFFAIFSPSVSKSLSSFLSKNSFSLGNLYFFLYSFVPFGLLEEFGCFGLFEEFVPFGFLGFFSGPFEEFVPFGLLEEFGWLLVLFRKFVRFWSFWRSLFPFWFFWVFSVLLEVFLVFFGPFRSFWGVCSFWSFGRVWVALVLLRSLFLLVFWKEFGPLGLLCLSLLPYLLLFSLHHMSSDYW